MDIATIIGLILGAAIILTSLLMGGVPVYALLQPEAILVVFGGTLTALFINFSFQEIQVAISGLSRAFYKETLTPEDVVDYLSDAAVFIRSKGVLAIQPLLRDVDIPFIQKGLQMILDNHPKEHMQSLLSTELEVSYRNDHQLSRVFEAAGGFAPTMGIIGAIIGLVQVMGMLNSPEQLGKEIACAFVATLYGVGSANLFFLPIAGKLKQRARDEWFLKSIMYQGLMAIHDGVHPTLIREQLEAFLYGGQEEETQIQETYLPAEVALGAV